MELEPPELEPPEPVVPDVPEELDDESADFSDLPCFAGFSAFGAAPS